MLYKLIVFGSWRTAESNRAGPAMLITNPVILVACPAPVFPAVPLPCRWRTSEWACGGEE